MRRDRVVSSEMVSLYQAGCFSTVGLVSNRSMEGVIVYAVLRPAPSSVRSGFFGAPIGVLVS